MQIYIQEKNDKIVPESYPCIVLVRDHWDDYDYRTTFYSYVHLNKKDKKNIGSVKILTFNQNSGYTKIKSPLPNGLSDEYCSLGGKIEYYEEIFSLGKEIYEDYLSSLKDVTFDESVEKKFHTQEGYKVSLLRFSEVVRMIPDAKKIFKTRSISFLTRKKETLNFSFETRLSPKSKPLVAKFDFERSGKLPNRINVIIGYNGSGKTKLLSNLAIAASGFGYEDKKTLLNKEYGSILDSTQHVKNVIVVSYSAFDNFPIPGGKEAERKRMEKEGNIFGYVYCGLREAIETEGNDKKTVDLQFSLKTMSKINDEFFSSLRRIFKEDREKIFIEVLEPLIKEPSFRTIPLAVLSKNKSIKQDDLANFYANLSSGHKIIIKILADVTAQMSLTLPSLLLIDEPEVHLHPSLQAAFLKSIRKCLDMFDGYAILTTHSPVLLQEMPSRYVQVLNRLETKSLLTDIDIETFGESISVITEAVFNLDDSMTNWNNTLEEMSKHYSFDKIESLFGKPLGFAPRSYLASISDEDE